MKIFLIISVDFHSDQTRIVGAKKVRVNAIEEINKLNQSYPDKIFFIEEITLHE